MTRLFIKITAFAFLSIFSLSLSAHRIDINPQICPYNHSSICYTYTGQACSMFIPNYQNNWFSACISQNFVHACLNFLYFPSQWVQSTCYLIGTPCTCAFGSYSGYYIYEQGRVL